MKKSIIILIGVIYVASIIFIGFFGMKISAYNQTVYVTGLECINEEVKVSNNKKSIIYTYKEDVAKEENVYILAWKVYPENSSDKSVKFVYDTSSKVASVDSNGRVWVNKKGVLTIQIVSQNNENVKEEITFLVK